MFSRTRLVLAALLLAMPMARADEPVATIPAPGFRPESALESKFLAEVDTATIAVYPTIIRRIERTAHSYPSRAEVIGFLQAHDVGQAFPANTRIDWGRLERQSQWDIFQAGLAKLAETIPGSQVEADYSLVVEILVPGDAAVFGIECYILNGAGENVFSFLLNAHHRIFAEADLVADESLSARNAMHVKATRVALQALSEQIEQARQCAQDSGEGPTPRRSTTIADFETGLTAGSTADGIALGLSTFNGPGSSVRISTTPKHPPVPGQKPGNAVLKLDFDLETWAGVLDRFPNGTGDTWLGYDWSDAQELSFWLHGQNTGMTLFVDVLDNRRRCSTMDDAERYSYQFLDHFNGWKLVSIPLEIMGRKDVGNAAPNDGLGLSPAHGWAFGALARNARRTLFIDDVRLQTRPLLENIPTGLSLERDIWVPINELPMFGGFAKNSGQLQADEEFIKHVLPQFGGDRGAAAENFANIGWNLHRNGDWFVPIKRFNQAWLLDPHNQKALWGFAVVSRARGRTESALKFYEMAVEAGPADPSLMQELEEFRQQLGQ